MIDGNEKRNRQLALELHVCEKRSNKREEKNQSVRFLIRAPYRVHINLYSLIFFDRGQEFDQFIAECCTNESTKTATNIKPSLVYYAR